MGRLSMELGSAICPASSPLLSPRLLRVLLLRAVSPSSAMVLVASGRALLLVSLGCWKKARVIICVPKGMRVRVVRLGVRGL